MAIDGNAFEIITSRYTLLMMTVGRKFCAPYDDRGEVSPARL
jgi:hypothetical protein